MRLHHSLVPTPEPNGSTLNVPSPEVFELVTIGQSTVARQKRA